MVLKKFPIQFILSEKNRLLMSRNPEKCYAKEGRDSFCEGRLKLIEKPKLSTIFWGFISTMSF
jgi:hypothetical protein